MSNATTKSIADKVTTYTKQNNDGPLTTAQKRQLRKTQTRLDHAEQRKIHSETKRNARQRFRDWMAGIRGE